MFNADALVLTVRMAVTMMSQIKLMDMILKIKMILKISEKLMMMVTIMVRLMFKVNIAMTATYMIFGLSLFMMVFHLVQVKTSSSSINLHQLQQLHCIMSFNGAIKDNNTWVVLN